MSCSTWSSSTSAAPRPPTTPYLSEEQRTAATQRALREARAAAVLQHASIVTVHDVVTDDDGRPCIVMDLLPGRSLDPVLDDEGPLPHGKVARIGLEILGALRAAHAQGVLHRDVKPANIFLREDGRAVLTDIGIAALAGEATLTREGSLIGSPAYMAPERVQYGPSGPASDLWSLGATLYALVEGRPPFARSTLMGTLGAVLADDPPPPRKPGPLAPLLMGLLVKDPDARLTADAAEHALRALVSGAAPPVPSAPPVPAGPAGRHPPVPSAPAGGRRRGAIALVTALAAALVGTGATVLITRDSGEADPAPTRSQARPASPTATVPPRFATPPSACGLITAERAALLVDDFTTFAQEDTDTSTGGPRRTCTWHTVATAEGDDDLDLELVAMRDTPSARDRLTREKADAVAPATPVEELGEGAFAQDGPNGGSMVTFRVDNLVVVLRYRTDGTRARQDRDVVRAALWTRSALGKT